MLGDEASVASIDPPEGSAQADHCARWYPIARDQVLEAHEWSFALRRIDLAQVAMPYTQWAYAYALPDDCLKLFAVLPKDATDDYTFGTPFPAPSYYAFPPRPQTQGYVPQDFTTEGDEDGNIVVYTNVPEAVARYVVRIDDPTKFPPLVVQSIATLLSSYLAGPVIKGTEGIRVGQAQLTLAGTALSRAITADGQRRQVRPEPVTSWMAGRH